jgi:threonine dehydratase
VTEVEIATSLREFMGNQHMLIEGSAAVAIAAFLKVADSFIGKRIAIVLCGANISLDTLKMVL